MRAGKKGRAEWEIRRDKNEKKPILFQFLFSSGTGPHYMIVGVMAKARDSKGEEDNSGSGGRNNMEESGTGRVVLAAAHRYPNSHSCFFYDTNRQHVDQGIG